MNAFVKCLLLPKVSPVRRVLYNATVSKAASPGNVFRLIKGCLEKKSLSVGIKSFEAWTDLSSSGESDFFSTTIDD